LGCELSCQRHRFPGEEITESLAADDSTGYLAGVDPNLNPEIPLKAAMKSGDDFKHILREVDDAAGVV
jgi:hypothetical protein